MTQIEAAKNLYEKVTGKKATPTLVERWRKALGAFADLPRSWRPGNAWPRV